jgi:hypothetical protein
MTYELCQHRDPVALLQPGGDDDPHLLRGLLWCDICAEAMLPVQIPVGVRQYACPIPSHRPAGADAGGGLSRWPW